MNIYSEPTQIVMLVGLIEDLRDKMIKIDDDFRYCDWINAEMIQGLTESEDRLFLLDENGDQIAEWSSYDCWVNQWTMSTPDNYHGYMYFGTGFPGTYVRVYFEM